MNLTGGQGEPLVEVLPHGDHSRDIHEAQAQPTTDTIATGSREKVLSGLTGGDVFLCELFLDNSGGVYMSYPMITVEVSI